MYQEVFWKAVFMYERKEDKVEMIIYWLVSFGASIIGAICGIGGGVIIKPVLDMVQVDSVSAISFLSGCTVLAMSTYSVGRSMIAKEKSIDLKIGTPLAIGAAIGGVLGKQLFSVIETSFGSANVVGAVQASTLAVITFGTLLYTLFKNRIHTLTLHNKGICAVIGVALGILSSFLGIGGGPINLVLLFYFFSMDTKIAAQNSIYIILFSQAASLIATLVTHSVPEFSIEKLILMVIGGILGGMAGRMINKKLSARVVDKLFIVLMGVIILINIYNLVKFIG